MKIVPVVCAIIKNKWRFFVAQRPANKQLPNKWEFPGGKVEPGETNQQALKRELFEELDIEVEIGEMLAVTLINQNIRTIKLMAYSAIIINGKPVLKEHQSANWFTKTELNKLDLCSGDKALLDLI